MASLDVIALDPTVPQLRAPGVGDTYHFCRVVEFQDGTNTAPSITNVGDDNTGLYWPNADELAVTTGGVQRLSLGATTVFNETGADVDFRVEGDTNANLVFVDASADRVGLGLNNPDRLLDVNGSSKFRGQILITSGEALTLGLQALQMPTGVESTIGAGLSTRTGVAGESIIQFGNNMNTYYTGSVNAAKAGAMIRIDTRGVEPTPGASAYSVFQIQTRAAGVADPSYTVPVQIGAAPQGTFCIQTNGLATFNYGFVVNEGGGDYDTRFEGDTDTHLFFADASTDRIGIGTSTPGYKLDVNGTANFANDVTFTGGTANGVLYLNGSKVATSGSALVFDGTNLGVGASPSYKLDVAGSSRIGASGASTALLIGSDASTTGGLVFADATRFITGSVANNPYLFYVNNTEQMRLTSTGLGIGTSSPASKLHVSNTAAATRITITDDVAAGRSGYIESNYSDALVIGTTSGVRGIRFSPDNTPRMYLDTSGNLGIGTSSPTIGLSVEKDNGSGYIAAFRANNTSPYLTIQTTGGITQLQGINSAFSATNNIAMQISGGNVGIGTSSPAAKLEVYNPSVNGAFAANTTSTWRVAQVRNDQTGTSGSAAGIAFVGKDSTQPAGIVAINGNTTGGLVSLAFLTVDSNTIYERARIDASGNLGLGVSPSAWNTDYRALQIKGGITLSNDGSNTDLRLGQNVFVNSSAQNIYIATAAASRYRQSSGSHIWDTAASGTAGNTISFTQAMTLNASGELLIGKTSAGVGTDGAQFLPTGFSGVSAAGTTAFFLNRNTNDGTILEFGRNGVSAATMGITSSALTFGTGGTERARITAAGSVVAGGSVALATTATDGFLYVPTCAGTPTGTPTAITGMAPIVVDTTNNKLYFYSGGQWRDAGP